MNIPWQDLPTFDWRSILSAGLGALVAWLSALLAKKSKSGTK